MAEENISISSEEVISSKDIVINHQEINDDKDKDKDEDEDGWLRLSLGIRPSPTHQRSLPAGGTSSIGGDELGLTTLAPTITAPTFFVQPPRRVVEPAMTNLFTQYHMNTCYFPFRPNYPSPLRLDFRPHSAGLWFILQASQTQTKEPYLPQVPKSYLRIKDGRTTVGLLIKYLVYKLKLEGEFEIGITCKGQELLPFLSLQHVRDNIWNRPRRKDVVFLSSASADHLIMVLNYGRIA